jgi:hypothetical protein
MGQPAVEDHWDIDLAVLNWPELDPGDWFPPQPPPKALHTLHWRRRLAMLQAIGDECSQTPIGAS